MPWAYKVDEISTTARGSTYVKVNMWRTAAAERRGDPPNIVEEFLMNLKAVRKRAVRDERGYTLRESGVYASPRAPSNPDDPSVKEDVDVDVAARMEKNITNFIGMVERTGRGDDPGDNLLDPVRSNADPQGILARDDVKAVKGRTREFRP